MGRQLWEAAALLNTSPSALDLLSGPGGLDLPSTTCAWLSLQGTMQSTGWFPQEHGFSTALPWNME